MDEYCHCLYNNPSIHNDNYKNNFKNVIKKENSINTEELLLYNLDKDLHINKDNPFFDIAKYYKYPTLLRKNIFQTNEDSFKLFKKFLKDIYSSKLLEEIYYLTPEFEDFEYPLSNEKILDEMIENTIFLPFDQQVLHGYTQKQFTKIYISTKLSKNKNEISKNIIEIGFLMNTMIHEQFKHYIKGLLFYNSFRFQEYKELDSDISSYEQDKFFIDNIRLKYSEEKDIKLKPVIDGGNRAEIYLYGDVLHKLYLIDALNMFDYKTWRLSVLSHLEEFNNNNNKKTSGKKLLTINEIINDKNMNKYLKDLFYQYNKFYKCNNKIQLNYGCFGSQRFNDYSISISEKKELVLDYSTYSETTIITIPDTETNKKFFHIFEQ